MQISPYIFFNGNAQAAIDFYVAVLGAEVTMMMRMGEGPPDMGIPEEAKDQVMHCTLKIGGQEILLSDDFAGNSPAMAGCNIMISYPTAAEAAPVFAALSDGGEVRMKWEPTFWSAGFGSCSDKFGIRWMVTCDEPPAS